MWDHPVRLRGLRGGWWYFQVPWDYRPYQPETRRYTASPQSTESFPNNERTDAKKGRGTCARACAPRESLGGGVVDRNRGNACCAQSMRSIVSLDRQGRESYYKIEEGWYRRISFSRDGYRRVRVHCLCVSCVIITAIGSCERATRHCFTGGEIRSGSCSTSAFLLSDWWTRFHRDYKFLKSDAGLDRRNKDDDFFQRNVIAVTSFSFPLFSPNTFARWRQRKSRKVCHLATWMNFSRIPLRDEEMNRAHLLLCAFLFFFVLFFFLSFFLSSSFSISISLNFLNCSSHSSFIPPSCTHENRRRWTVSPWYSCVFVSECEVISRVYVVNIRDVTG